MLRLNMTFLLTIIAIYANDTYYLKRGLSAIAISEVVRRFFIWFSRDDDLAPAVKSSFEFLFSILGSSLGTVLYNAHHSIQAKFVAQEHAIATFTNLSKTFDPSVNYVRAEALDFSFNPMYLITGYNPLRLTWGNSIQTYQTICEIHSDFNGQTGVVTCDAPQKLPPMLPKQ